MPITRLLAFSLILPIICSINVNVNATDDRPNILFALADDWSWPHC